MNVRALLRGLVPFGVRVAVRRVPATARWLLARDTLRGTPADFSHVQCARATPLRRATAFYGEALQAAKEQNVCRAAELVSGAVVGAGETFSWHAYVGPPVALRGFAPGPELHGDALEQGDGGGLCQVANLVYWLALHAGLEVVERHRHALDLFPDHDRTAPFGCGATVFFPTKDLRLSNPLPQALLLELWVDATHLHGRARLARDPGVRFRVEETDARFTREADGVWRHNVLWRVRTEADGRELRERLAEHHARVAYPLPPAVARELDGADCARDAPGRS